MGREQRGGGVWCGEGVAAVGLWSGRHTARRLTRAADSSRIVAGRGHTHTASTPTTGPTTQQRHTQDTGDVGRPHLVPAQRLALGLCRGCGLTDRVLGARLLRLRLALALAHRLELKQLLEEHRDVARSGESCVLCACTCPTTPLTIPFRQQNRLDALQVPCTPRHPPPPPLQRHVLPDRRTRVNHGPQGPRHERQAVPEGSPVRMRLRDRRQVRAVLCVCHAFLAYLFPALPVPFFTAEVATAHVHGICRAPTHALAKKAASSLVFSPELPQQQCARDPHGTARHTGHSKPALAPV